MGAGRREALVAQISLAGWSRQVYWLVGEVVDGVRLGSASRLMIRSRRAILVLFPVSPVACWLSQSRWPAALRRFENTTGGCCEADPPPSSALRI
ncbi:MAG: hypothetical protein CMJ70_01955 [Planctomycetaceae bacterium]|nr:hypothetical protein [Planctomycetaceae bacterium]